MELTKRTILGKKNKKLRKSGLIPGVIYDKEVNIAVQIPYKSFIKTYDELGHTGISKQELDGEKYNLMIDQIQINPSTREPIHVTLRNVNMKEEINAMVPVEYTGMEEAKGVKDEDGVVVQNVSEVEVIALPANIPSVLTIDVTNMALGDVIKIEDIKLPEGVRFATEDENILGQVAVTITHKAAAEPEPVASEAEEFVATKGSEEKAEESPADENKSE